MKTTLPQSLNRRDFVRVGAIGTLGLSLADFARLADAADTTSATADSVIFVNLAGGPSHLDTLDMKPDAPSDTQGEFDPIQSKIAGLHVCEHLPKLAQMMDKFTLIRGISHSAGAHPQGQSWISTGNRPTPAVTYPAFGSVIMNEFPGEPELPTNVAIPKTEWNPGYMGDAYAAFKTNTVPHPDKPFQVRGLSLADGLTIEKVNQREQLLKKLDRTFRDTPTNSRLAAALDEFGQQAYRMITSARSQQAFDVAREPASIRNRFTADELNQSCLLACRLIEHGTRFVTVTNQGWDSHLDNFTRHKQLLLPLDNALVALVNSLEEKGLLDRTLVIAMGEFGRTPKINVNAGRDHFPRANWSLMSGGGVRGGQLIGGTNRNGDGPDDGTDIKPDDIAATLYRSLGIDPKTEYHTSAGRPVMLVPEGRVLADVFG
jgi:uncharacterized protein (DUF1501 family)